MGIFSICFFQSWNSAAQTYPSGPRRSKAAPWVTELKAPAPFLCSEYEEILVTPGNLKSTGLLSSKQTHTYLDQF